MIVLDASRMREQEAAHAYLRRMLSFPDYYGNNLDALYDCLTELEETEIRFVNGKEAAQSDFPKLLSVFQEAARDNPRLRIRYE